MQIFSQCFTLTLTQLPILLLKFRLEKKAGKRNEANDIENQPNRSNTNKRKKY